MDLKVQILASAIRLYRQKIGESTPASDAFGDSISRLFGTETPDERAARQIIEMTGRLVGAVKTKNTNRKFEKIVKDI